MSIVTTHPAAEVAADGQHLMIPDVSWEGYQTIGQVFADRPALRLTYDGGCLEIMVTSSRHEVLKKWHTRLIEMIAEEFATPFATAGNMTFQEESLAKGLEADDCFWFAHEPQMRGKLDFDPQIDPPPDLALEIEVSRGVLDRLDIYAAMKVPEVWASDGARLTVWLLQADGTYHKGTQSLAFPQLPLDRLSPFLSPTPGEDVLAFKKRFLQWLQRVLGKE